MALPTIEVEPTAIKERSADERGRVNLGPDYADRTLRVAVVEVLDDDDQPENQQQSG